jgi:DNA polymerase III subunit epsilon
MPIYCVFDVETNGLPRYDLPADDPSQPRLASITMLLCGPAPDIELVSEHNYYVKPDGWTMSEEVSKVNGITTELLEENGVPVREVLDFWSDRVRDQYVAVAYNSQFDTKIVRGELRRAGMDDLFEQTKSVCAMRSTKGLTIPKASGKGGFPKLSDTYLHLFKEPLAGAHGSSADAHACLRIFRELVRMKLDLPPAVHYARERT